MSKLCGSKLPHERYKQIVLDIIEAQSEEEIKVKRLSNAFIYVLNNTKQSLGKEQLEEMVVEKVKTVFLENSDLEKIAEYICKAYNSMAIDDASLKTNERALAKNKKETDNIVNAIASGIINDALRNRLDELQEEKKD